MSLLTSWNLYLICHAMGGGNSTRGMSRIVKCDTSSSILSLHCSSPTLSVERFAHLCTSPAPPIIAAAEARLMTSTEGPP